MAEDEIIKKHTKIVYKTWRDPEKDWFTKLKDLLLEIIIIVFAVSVSIWFHNWSDSLNNRKEEKEFLRGLKSDLRTDLKEMKDDKASLEKESVGIHYFETIGGGVNLSDDSLNKYGWIFFSKTQINPRISRFEALKGSGKLDIIENKKLQYNIIDLYQKNFIQIFRLNENINSIMADKVVVFMGDNAQLDANAHVTNGQEIMRKPKMRFLLFQAEGIRNNIKAYLDGIDKGNEIIKQIDEELK